MSLSEDVKNYKNLQLAFHIKVPQKIIDRWQNYIIPRNFSSLGEKGVDAFIGRRKYGEKTLVYHAYQADVERCLEMADGFWKKAYAVSLEEPKPKSKKSNKSVASKQPEKPKVFVIEGKDRNALRDWWHEILRTHGRYSCYAIFLTLPSDTEALRYLTNYGNELNLIAGENCLVVTLSTTGFQRTGFDNEGWRKFIEEQTSNGYSIIVANIFAIPFTKFPCLLLFQDIRSPEHVAVTLTEMTAEEIKTRMRLVFTVIQKAVNDHKKPLEELEKQQNIEFVQKTTKLVANKIGGYADKTFEKAMEAWITAAMKQQQAT